MLKASTTMKTTVTETQNFGSVVIGRKTAAQNFRDIMQSGKLGFFSFARSEDYFLDPHNQRYHDIPQCGQEVFRMQIKSWVFLNLFWYVMKSAMRATLWRSLQCTLAAGALGTFVHLL